MLADNRRRGFLPSGYQGTVLKYSVNPTSQLSLSFRQSLINRLCPCNQGQRLFLVISGGKMGFRFGPALQVSELV